MNYSSFLERIIDDGIEAAKKSYSRPKDSHKLAGSLSGFEACRGKGPAELKELLEDCRRRTGMAHQESSDEAYWMVRCFELEVEWVCNVVSAALMNQNEPIIIPPTARGLIKAAEIIGVSAPQGPLN